MKFKFDDNEIKQILEMHSKHKKVLVEQQSSTDTKTVDVQLKELLDSGCVPFGTVVTMNSKNPQLQFAIKQESKKTPGKFRYLFIDNRVAVKEGGKMSFITEKWECAKSPKKDEVKPADPTKPLKKENLNNNQLKVLEIIAPMGWKSEPVPTDVEIDQGIFEKIDLSNKDADENVQNTNAKYTDIIEKYSKWFPSVFHVYKKVVREPSSVEKGKELDVSGQQCRVAINNLFNNMERPNKFPLTNKEKNDAIAVVRICAQKNRLLKLGGNKLDKVAREYGIIVKK